MPHTILSSHNVWRSRINILGIGGRNIDVPFRVKMTERNVTALYSRKAEGWSTSPNKKAYYYKRSDKPFWSVFRMSMPHNTGQQSLLPQRDSPSSLQPEFKWGKPNIHIAHTKGRRKWKLLKMCHTCFKKKATLRQVCTIEIHGNFRHSNAMCRYITQIIRRYIWLCNATWFLLQHTRQKP